ncbi:hypothetical protein [Brevibacillus nitrificans]|uniref:hypothetical protein n=1 Tax=Brevibacillus nitrificans TaxID=651560 RepID=UPI00285EC508|nr:hypothetical protein [Brevibacillus nitrificans]MDR7315875.1 hypothetical protein [Brevibacillus nitrificans]
MFSNNCIEFCEYCSNFIFNPAINEREQAIQWLADSSRVLEVKIRESIELMKEISTSLANSLRKANNDVLKTSRQLLSYMDIKATIDFKLMEESAYEQKSTGYTRGKPQEWTDEQLKELTLEVKYKKE